ncbi:MAG: YggS family pyridoxal phosphate-dependent enzyme [Pseudomonadota bacterium]|nr:YggS family pyridoxal phosphate-dependent enzyme [Pseudomonadota bacterium]
MTSISANIERVRLRIHDAETRYGRPPDSVLLLAASKARHAEEIRAATRAGLRHFGENYLQDAAGKMDLLADTGIVWHFIGPIQSNKTREIAGRFDWVHSVDRLKIARRLNMHRSAGAPPLNVCIQVNLASEPTKSGVDAAGLPALAGEIAGMDRLRLRGLMAIPPRSPEPQIRQANFAAVRMALESLRGTGLELDTLSMGMSADLEAAIAEGATIVRVGTAIFGPRPK